MEPYQERVIAEKDDLDTRLEALRKFIDTTSIFTSLPVVDQSLMRLQAIHMHSLSTVLARRIARFKP